MKYLVKAKAGNTLVSVATGEFLDEYRFRVFSGDMDIRTWDSRKLIDIKALLKDEATDVEFKTLFAAKGDSAIAEFVDKYSLKAEPEKAKAEPEKKVVEEVKEEPKAEPEVKPEVKEEPKAELEVKPAQPQGKKNKKKTR